MNSRLHLFPLSHLFTLRSLNFTSCVLHGLVLAVVIALVGCQGEDPNNAGAQAGGGGTNPSGPLQQNMEAIDPRVIGLSIGQDALALAKEIVGTTTQAIEVASISAGTGQVVTWGTVGQSANQVVYQPTPTDRLILQTEDGNNITIVVEDLQGTFTGAETFLTGDHSLRAQWYIEGLINLTVQSTRSGRLTQGSIQGGVVINEVSYQLNLVREEQVIRNEVEYGTAARDSEETLTGTVSSSNLSAQISEGYRYKFVLVDNAVENITRVAQNTWTYDGDQYGLQDAQLQYETFDGWPNPSDFWFAQGVLLKNGQPIGQVVLDEQPLWIDFLLQLNDGTKHQIRRHLLRNND